MKDCRVRSQIDLFERQQPGRIDSETDHRPSRTGLIGSKSYHTPNASRSTAVSVGTDSTKEADESNPRRTSITKNSRFSSGNANRPSTDSSARLKKQSLESQSEQKSPQRQQQLVDNSSSHSTSSTNSCTTSVASHNKDDDESAHPTSNNPSGVAASATPRRNNGSGKPTGGNGLKDKMKKFENIFSPSSDAASKHELTKSPSRKHISGLVKSPSRRITIEKTKSDDLGGSDPTPQVTTTTTITTTTTTTTKIIKKKKKDGTIVNVDVKKAVAKDTETHVEQSSGDDTKDPQSPKSQRVAVSPNRQSERELDCSAHSCTDSVNSVIAACPKNTDSRGLNRSSSSGSLNQLSKTAPALGSINRSKVFHQYQSSLNTKSAPDENLPDLVRQASRRKQSIIPKERNELNLVNGGNPPKEPRHPNFRRPLSQTVATPKLSVEEDQSPTTVDDGNQSQKETKGEDGELSSVPSNNSKDSAVVGSPRRTSLKETKKLPSTSTRQCQDAVVECCDKLSSAFPGNDGKKVGKKLPSSRTLKLPVVDEVKNPIVVSKITSPLAENHDENDILVKSPKQLSTRALKSVAKHAEIDASPKLSKQLSSRETKTSFPFSRDDEKKVGKKFQSARNLKSGMDDVKKQIVPASPMTKTLHEKDIAPKMPKQQSVRELASATSSPSDDEMKATRKLPSVRNLKVSAADEVRKPAVPLKIASPMKERRDDENDATLKSSTQLISTKELKCSTVSPSKKFPSVCNLNRSLADEGKKETDLSERDRSKETKNTSHFEAKSIEEKTKHLNLERHDDVDDRKKLIHQDRQVAKKPSKLVEVKKASSSTGKQHVSDPKLALSISESHENENNELMKLSKPFIAREVKSSIAFPSDSEKIMNKKLPSTRHLKPSVVDEVKKHVVHSSADAISNEETKKHLSTECHDGLVDVSKLAHQDIPVAKKSPKKLSVGEVKKASVPSRQQLAFEPKVVSLTSEHHDDTRDALEKISFPADTEESNTLKKTTTEIEVGLATPAFVKKYIYPGDDEFWSQALPKSNSDDLSAIALQDESVTKSKMCTEENKDGSLALVDAVPDSNTTRRRSRGVSRSLSVSLHSHDDIERSAAAWKQKKDNKKRKSKKEKHKHKNEANLKKLSAPKEKKTICVPAVKDLKLHKILGEGSFGQVWLASFAESTKHDDSIDDKKRKQKTYALKILSKFNLIQNSELAALGNEIDILKIVQNQHPCIMNLVAATQDDNLIYLMQDFAQGGELFSVLHKLRDPTTGIGGLPEEQACFYAACLADALCFLHSKHHLVFRDLKPENVMLNKHGYPVIIDFGYAKILDISDPKTFTLVGTPRYMCPELILSLGYDFCADNWSLGVLIYELLTGYNPFEGPLPDDEDGLDEMDFFEIVVEEEYVPLPKTGDISKEAEDIISGLLTKEPSLRLGYNDTGLILDHVWFSRNHVDFHNLRRRKLEAPWVPEIDGPLDTRHFDDWDHLASNQDTCIIKEDYPKLTDREQLRFKFLDSINENKT